jgi:hypothetical protein
MRQRFSSGKRNSTTFVIADLTDLTALAIAFAFSFLIRFKVATDQLLHAIQTSIINRNQYAPKIIYQRTIYNILHLKEQCNIIFQL